MAKTKKTDEEVEDSNSGSIEDAFKVLDKMNENATFLNENSLSTVNEWIDTGSYALNAIISGSLYGGIPMGRLSGFVGPESCGKTLMANKIMANAQKKGMYVAYFDTEGALDSNTATRLGCDAKKIKHIPSEITEQCRNEIVKFLDTVIQNKLQGKVLLVIDSLGNLVTAHEKAKMERGEESLDMGGRAKACLDPNTNVYTVEGFKKLKDLNVGDLVLTHLGRYKKVTDKWNVDHDNYIKIKTKKSEIILSKNHKLLIKRNSQLLYVEAQHIKNTDKLLQIIEQNN